MNDLEGSSRDLESMTTIQGDELSDSPEQEYDLSESPDVEYDSGNEFAFIELTNPNRIGHDYQKSTYELFAFAGDNYTKSLPESFI